MSKANQDADKANQHSANYETPIHEQVALANEGRNPRAVIRLKSGWVMIANPQTVDGYCQLFSDPVVPSINSLSEQQRIDYSLDTIRVGDALLEIMGAKRINYETWCNQDPALHTHIVPRYENEPDEKRKLPVCKGYDATQARAFDVNLDGGLIAKLRAYLKPFARK